VNFIIIALGSLILGCAIYVSYNHTIELFVVHGTPYVHALAATVTVELIFVLSALIIVVGKLKHRPIGFIGTAGFLYGAGISGWANVSYYASHGISGWLIGLSIPLGVLISEAMVTKAITEFSSKSKHPVVSNSNSSSNDYESSSKLEPSSHDSNPEKSSSNPGKAGASNLNESNSRSPGIFNSNSNVESSPENIPTSNSESNSSSNSNLNAGKSSSNKSSSTTGTTGQTGKETKLEVLEGGKKLEPELEHIKQVALEIYRKEGKVPGRPRIQKETGCNEGQAKRVRAWLKEELGA